MPRAALPPRSFLRPATVLLLVALIVAAWGAWEFVLPHRYESGAPLTRMEALRHSPIDLPATAHDIHIATYRHWIQRVHYVRFEAPVHDCEAAAARMMPGAPLLPFTGDPFAPRAFNPGSVFKDLSWFAPDSITNGFYASVTEPTFATIYIDRIRGIVYFTASD